MFIRSVRDGSDLDGFRREVASFCRTEMPAEVRRKQERAVHLDRAEYDEWMRRIGDRGWLAGRWPVEHGGLGWGAERSLAFEEELGRAGAPPVVTFGTALAGPVIYTFGSSRQRRRYLEDIARNRTWWCQGYSEPGAGSDLASLRTRAVRDGDHYVVDGQKTWTSYAHWADMMFALVRTDPDAKKQEGISFLLIDMRTSGITVRPIIGITLGHHLNEVFLENVRVPVENLIGEENKGWTYAKFLLANERVNGISLTRFEDYLAKVGRLLGSTKEDGRPLSESRTFRLRMAELEVGLACVKALMADRLAAAGPDGAPSLMTAAALKLRGTELQQAILQTGADVLGRQGLAYQSDALHAGWNGDLIGPAESAGLIYEHLYRRAASIYSGSSEVQRNILAKGALGL